MNHPLLPWLILHKAHSSQLKRLAHSLSLPALIDQEPGALKQLGLKPELIRAIQQPCLKSIEEDLAWLGSKKGRHIIHWEDPRYPSLLKEIPDPPLLLYVEGRSECLAEPQLAIVGSRSPSPLGLNLAEQFADGLSRSGLAITSGLALGIDGASHRAALAAQGSTIAVLGSGLNCIYPKAHAALAAKIAEQGLLLSEYSPQSSPLAHHFPERNRIISGLCLGTLVVEASLKSGSLITARLATDQGREVFAIPGSPHNTRAQGCNRLIQQGVKLVGCIEDILEELEPLFQASKPLHDTFAQTRTQIRLEADQAKLLECIGFEASSIDQIALRSGFSVAATAAVLLILELRGYISTTSGGYIRTLA